MVNRIDLQKKLLQLGTISVALMIGTVSLGCSKAVETEETKETAPIVVAEAAEAATPTVEATATPSPTPTVEPTNTPSPTPTVEPTNTPEPTEEPKETSPDPYVLTDDEAIDIGTYIFDNYVTVYSKNPKTFMAKATHPLTKEDIINYVCHLNQKYPVLYPKRESSLKREDMIYINSLYEDFLNANFHCSSEVGKNNLFPFSTFLKEGRPEKALLEELESEFKYITDNDVLDEEIYAYWAKVVKISMNVEETLKDWHSFDFKLFYYTIKSQVYFAMWCPEPFNGNLYSIPASYVFGNNKKGDLRLDNMFYMRYSVNRNTFRNLTNEEFTLFVGCLEEYLDKYCIDEVDTNYIRSRHKEG